LFDVLLIKLSAGGEIPAVENCVVVVEMFPYELFYAASLE
jgi:hypothetical protein